MDGLFSLANKLFGINVEPADGLAPVRYFLLEDTFCIYVLRLEAMLTDSWVCH